MAKNVKITVDTGKTLPLNYLQGIQGELKELSPDNAKKLEKSILKHGFAFPMFVWEDQSDAQIKLIDGHMRLAVLEKMKEKGYSIPQLPVVFIEAQDIKEAKEKLLLTTSSYGKFTEKGMLDFTLDIDFENILNIAEVPKFDFSFPKEEKEKDKIHISAHEREKVKDEIEESDFCPDCGAVLKKKVKIKIRKKD